MAYHENVGSRYLAFPRIDVGYVGSSILSIGQSKHDGMLLMKRIHNLFVHRVNDDLEPIGVKDEPNPLAKWVFEENPDGSYNGVATKMYDGLACYVDTRGLLHKRVVIPPGKTPPTTFVPAEPFKIASQMELDEKLAEYAGRPDKRIGEWPGWVPVSNADPYHISAWDSALGRGRIDTTGVGVRVELGRTLRTGTYELIGPEVKGNPENVPMHMLVKHGEVQYPHCPRDFYGLKDFIDDMGIHGVVFHKSPGSVPGVNEMAKITGADFGLIRTTRKGS